MKIYIIIQDDKNNLHQGHLKKEDEIIISNLVKVYPNNNITKDFINNVAIELAKKVNFKKVEQ